MSLILAHQFLDQLDTKLRSAVINTVGTLVSFRIGYKDARAIVYEMFPTPDFPRYRGDIDTGSWEQLALELANLPPRILGAAAWTVSANQTTYAGYARSVNNPHIQMALQQLIETSGRLYDAKRQLPSTSAPVATLLAPATDNDQASTQTNTIRSREIRKGEPNT
ncbi:MAG: hypothetical protein R3E39_06425 [Anaerolineae bacterium]